MTALPFQRNLPRRAVVNALLALPALALCRSVLPPPTPPSGDEVVEVSGWFLKRSEVA